MPQISHHPYTARDELLVRATHEPSRHADPLSSSPEEILSWAFADETPDSYLTWTAPQAFRRCPGAGRGVRGNRSVRSGLRVRADFAWPFKTARRPTC
ncbi:MAG TPA: hypothetical protein VK680_02445 [Solirubrobacteraceae bacterium]|jgi:hypothetical protein|nr:hypothetical protein [Solirubrobacteraceae bacterium]